MNAVAKPSTLAVKNTGCAECTRLANTSTAACHVCLAEHYGDAPVAAARILTKAQAAAVFAAMVALNNVTVTDGIRLALPGMIGDRATMIEVVELAPDHLKISYGGGMLDHEREYHGGQAAFAAAYGVA